MNAVDALLFHSREYIALRKALFGMRNRLRSHVRILHATGLAPLALSPEDRMPSPAAFTDEPGENQLNADTQSPAVPSWLTKPPVGLSMREWHPEPLLQCSPAAQILLAHCGQLAQDVVFRRKQLEAAAKALPVWPWVEAIRGVDAFGLGMVLGATGDLSNYANPAKVWKRMGLGLVDGQRQRRVIDAELAIRMGYNPERRAMAYNLAKGLINQNKLPDGSPAYYRTVYIERKTYEQAKAPELSKQAWHLRAGRYMVKRFLRELWREWQRVTAAPGEEAPYA